MNADGHRMKLSQGQREQSINAAALFPAQGVSHRLMGLSFNTAYQIDVTPILRSNLDAGAYGESKSVFCRTQSKRKLAWFVKKHVFSLPQVM